MAQVYALLAHNRQRFTPVEIMAAYERLGFVAEDLFVVVRNNRPGSAEPCGRSTREKTTPTSSCSGNEGSVRRFEASRQQLPSARCVGSSR